MRFTSLGLRAVTVLGSLGFAAGAYGAGITLQQTGAPFNNPIGVAYNPTNTSLIVTSNYSGGSPNSLMRIDQFGNTSPWSSASGYPGERYLDIPRAVNQPSGWTSGETFTGNGQVGQIARISANGATVNSNWVTLPGETGLPAGQLRFDNTGIFNNDLIVTTTSGNVWQVSSTGSPTLLANLGTSADFEGLAVVPNNPTRYGPLAGRIIVGHEGSTDLWTVDPIGNVSQFPNILPAQCEGLHVIPANEHFVGVDYLGGSILWANQSEFAPFVGDIMVVSEIIGANPGNPSGLNRLLWNGSGSFGFFTTSPIGLTQNSLLPQLWEGSTFAPIVVPEPGTAILLSLAGLLAARRWR
ncbi:MAG: PEP-CTERM sorting domain-containing protein [Phycisphaerae bacterium]